MSSTPLFHFLRKNNFVYLDCTFQGTRLRLATGIKVYDRDWDDHHKTVKVTNARTHKLVAVLDAKMREAENCAEEILKMDAKLDSTTLRTRLYPERKQKLSFLEEYEFAVKFCNCRETTRRKKYSTFSRLKEFEQQQKVKLHNWYFTVEGYGMFLQWLQSLHLRDASIRRHVVQLKWFLKQANPRMDLAHIQYRDGASSIIFLEPDELEEFWTVDLQGQFDVWRDYLIVMCYTGMRYSDAAKINPDIIDKSRRELYYIQTKTGKEAIPPILPKVEFTLVKYPDGRLPALSNQKLNQGLKKLAECMGMDRVVKDIYSLNGKVIEDQMPLYEAITSHIGRKTFIMNAINAGVPTRAIMKMTGHKGEAPLRFYIDHAKIDTDKYYDDLASL